MGGSEWMREWAKMRKFKLKPSLEMMETGKLKTRTMQDGTFVDTTEATKAVFRDMIAELDRIIEGGRPDGVGGADT